MNFQGLLNQLLTTDQNGNQGLAQSNQGGSNPLSSLTASNPLLSGLASGAVSGSLMGMLMGSKRGNKMGKGAMKMGGMAAVGMLALKAFQNWQKNQHQQPAFGQAQTAQAGFQPVSTQALTEPDESTSQLLLKAMIGAAKADGHVDDKERQLIQQSVQQSGADANVSQFIEAELAKPLDPAEIAAGVSSPELAAEMYLVSAMIVDDESFMEKNYLQELARQLNISPELAQQLEQQVA